MYTYLSRKEREKRAERMSNSIEILKELSVDDRVDACDFGVDMIFLLFIAVVMVEFFVGINMTDAIVSKYGNMSWLYGIMTMTVPLLIFAIIGRSILKILVEWRAEKLLLKQTALSEVLPEKAQTEEVQSLIHEEDTAAKNSNKNNTIEERGKYILQDVNYEKLKIISEAFLKAMQQVYPEDTIELQAALTEFIKNPTKDNAEIMLDNDYDGKLLKFMKRHEKILHSK